MSTKTALAKRKKAALKSIDALLPALRNAIAMWADATTAAGSKRRADLLRDKSKAVADFLAFTGKGPDQVIPLDVKVWQAELEGRGLAPATPPNRTETWTEGDITFRAEFWDDLVLPDVKVNPANPTFTVGAIYDPRYHEPWLLACPLQLSGAALRGLYRDRWPVEQVPLTAKQILGGVRQFVFALESQQRLPELTFTLLAGSIITYLAATLPATPTVFWDRQPKPTPGRLRRVLARTPFPKTYPLPERIRKKASVFEHLPKGILGHRRKKQAASA